MSLLLPLLLRILSKAYKIFSVDSAMPCVPPGCRRFTGHFTICLLTHSPMASFTHFHSFAYTLSNTLTVSFIQSFPSQLARASPQLSMYRDSKMTELDEESPCPRLLSDSLQPPRPGLCSLALFPVSEANGSQRCSCRLHPPRTRHHTHT